MTEVRDDRTPLKSGDELELIFRAGKEQIYTQKAVVEEEIGRGASCITYIVRLFTEEKIGVRMIMKEFYPAPGKETFEAKREGTRLCFAKETISGRTFRHMRDNFRKSYRLQTELSGGASMEIMVRPYNMAEYGDSYYILSDIHLGTILSKTQVKSFSDKLWLIYRAAEAVQILNEQGYLYIDLNPSNILWIPSQQSVKLFDVDSIVPWSDLENIHGIRTTEPYMPPEAEELREWFDVNKSVFLKPSWDVYCIGLVFYELLAGRLPGKNLTGAECMESAAQICSRYGCTDPEAEELLCRILTRSLSGKFRVRYPSAREMCFDLNRLKKIVDAQEFISKKEYARANYMMESYYILDRWPVFDYAVNEDGEKILDIAICGNHDIREPFFKAAFACVHMPGMKLRIRLYADDAAEFLEKQKKENPAFLRSVHIYMENKCIWGEEDRINAGNKICEKPMAEIYLYKRSREEMTADNGRMLKEIESGYLILLWPEIRAAIEKDNGAFAEKALPPVTDVKKCSCYDEKLFETRIMKWALNVHAFYYRGNYERATRKEIRETFENDIYNLESSVRSALAIRYKLKAAGIPASCVNPGEEFYRRVLAPEAEAGDVADILSDLEHQSWCAHLVINGWDRPSENDLEQYAFTGENDFKDRDRRLHPCLTASRPGNRLKTLEKKQWNRAKLSKKTADSLDDLELMCLRLHQIAKKKIRTAKAEAELLCARLECRLDRYQNEKLQEAFRWLVTVRERVFAGESNAEHVWNQAEEDLKRVCSEICKYDYGVREELRLLNRTVQVAHEYNRYHDYKKSDEDIVRGIPGILSDGSIKKIIRPYLPGRENHWKNILSTLFLEPDEVLFIPIDDADINVPFYRKFIAMRGSAAEIAAGGFSDIPQSDEDAVVDVTGLDPEDLKRIDRIPLLRNKRKVMVKNRRIRGIDDPMTEMCAREIHLTVEETFYLFEARMDSDKKENPILGLGSRYIGIWNAYKEIGAKSWKMLIETLVHAEGEKAVGLSCDSSGGKIGYKTIPVSGAALKLTGLDRVFLKCLEAELIASYRLPGEDDELPVEFSTKYGRIAAVLMDLTAIAEKEPLRHKYLFETGNKRPQRTGEKQKNYRIKDRTLYTRISKPKNTVPASDGEKNDPDIECIVEALRKLECNGRQGTGGRQNLIQNLKVSPGSTGTEIFFKYATEAVKACLQREGNILEAMIYFTCLGMGTFDDLNINSEFSWEPLQDNALEEVVNNEIDIIGTKNLKTYFISAKMCRPETAHLMEIKYFSEHFGIDGQAVLVTSNSKTAGQKDGQAGGREERSRLMGVKYINRPIIDEGKLGETLNAIIEEGEKERI